MTTGKDVLDEYLEITLHASERATLALVALAGFLALCFIVYAVLPRTGESRLAQRIEALKSWLGIPGAPRAVTTLVFGLGLIFTALFAIAVIAAFLLIWSVIAGGSADPSTTPTQSLGLGALLVALLSAPFVIWRSVVAQKTVDVTEQGLITDRINAAVEGLGAEKTVKEVQQFPGEPRKLPESSHSPFTFGSQVSMASVLRRQTGGPTKPIFESLERSVPNMEVRIGAIYALERIARENLDFHVQIMEILCAYIRENSPANSAEPLHIPEMPPEEGENPRAAWADWKEGYEDESGAWHDGLNQALQDLKTRIKPRTDIQTTLEVLGRRTPAQRAREAGWPDPQKDGVFVFDAAYPNTPPYPDTDTPEAHTSWIQAFGRFTSDQNAAKWTYGSYPGYRLDLRATNLQGYDLQHLHLNGARFEGAQMMGADLWLAQMIGTDLGHAQMVGADFGHAQMMAANFEHAQMMGANFEHAQMLGADLRGAQMQGANLIDAQMQGANLRDAQMMRADPLGAQMLGADLRDAKLPESPFLSLANLRGVAVNSVDKTIMARLRRFWQDFFADGSVSVSPEDRPAHWPVFEMDQIQFETEWRKWQADPEGYTPPDPPED
ncbi:pentapeptide repeat-containing protein [Fontisubflavum oceani]|uniref:pentapeptide repeat-containing protein n=1 Tax=Fontisubflavum oceani TaxID=2978973 RepID=UPI0025B430AF|nr:pentapeptide repeat-containing protein [Fontisubflavum oceani]WJY20123.1 pentapeptide repeat-containing protein [Fontisubflavum oceani]